jgi:cell division protein FtsI/penicillin-binding protein 2
VADEYEPGSVFKIVAIGAALQEGLATPRSLFDTTIESVPHPAYKNGVDMPDEDHRFPVPQAVTLAEAVSYSSNRAAAMLGLALGKERLDKYTRAFGFGSKLGFPVGGEISGSIYSVDEMKPLDVTRIAIGHSISATVLQMHQAMSVIANDGILLRPQIIREVCDSTGEVVFRYGPVELGRACSPDTARLLAQMLTGVASSHGTAVGAAIDGYDVAGKTGTTIKLVEHTLADGTKTLVWDRKHHIASFIGFFPAGRPQIAISVVVDDADHKAPNGVAYGGKVAAPSFKRIGERLIPILPIHAYHQSVHPSLMAATDGGRR